jgi:hypothetical protein
VLLAVLLGPAGAGADAETGNEEGWTYTVIRLEHAKAEQLAATLGRILPPDVTVVPDRPTNSLIIRAPSSQPPQPIAPAPREGAEAPRGSPVEE